MQVELPSVVSILGVGKKAITMAEMSIADDGSYAAHEEMMVERIGPMLEDDLAAANPPARTVQDPSRPAGRRGPAGIHLRPPDHLRHTLQRRRQAARLRG